MKDKIKQNTGTFICELGEAASTLKMVDWLKKFITNPIDEFRDPYARVSRKYPRLATFYITINDTSFLRDIENRRYWTIEIKDIDLNAINSICYENLWGEVYSWYLANPSGFRLTHSERLELNNINQNFRKMSVEEKVLVDCLEWSQPEADWTEKTATQISTEILNKTGQKIQPQKVGNILRNLGYDKEAPQKRWRTLEGKTLYNTPKVLLVDDYTAPYPDMVGQREAKGGVTYIQGYLK
jgi:putative DNA primase/helicase